MVKKIDATSGNLIKNIFAYTVPLILSTILQNLFNVADKAVLGNMAGSGAVASIGATSVITALIINGAVGLSTGTSVILARFVGQKDDIKVRKTIYTSLITAVFIGLLLAVFGVWFTPEFLTFTNCPADCYRGAVFYMRIIIASAPAILIYNYGSAILRTLGDTQKPLVYITISGVVNLVLNVILCVVLPQKVVAVAVATVVSSLLSAILVLRRISAFDENIKIKNCKDQFDYYTFGQMLKFGVPTAISALMNPIANLQIVSAINSYGVDAIAGCSASESIQNVLAAFTESFGIAAATFVGQNLGARDKEKVKKSFWYILFFTIIISGTLGVVTYLSGRFWLGIITGMGAKAAIDYGMQRMFCVTLFVFVSAINHVLSSSLQSFGYPLFVSISKITFTLGFRTFWMQVVYPQNQNFFTLMLCFLVSWSLNTLLYIVFYTAVYLRYVKKDICKKI